MGLDEVPRRAWGQSPDTQVLKVLQEAELQPLTLMDSSVQSNMSSAGQDCFAVMVCKHVKASIELATCPPSFAISPHHPTPHPPLLCEQRVKHFIAGSQRADSLADVTEAALVNSTLASPRSPGQSSEPGGQGERETKPDEEGAEEPPLVTPVMAGGGGGEVSVFYNRPSLYHTLRLIHYLSHFLSFCCNRQAQLQSDRTQTAK